MQIVINYNKASRSLTVGEFQMLSEMYSSGQISKRKLINILPLDINYDEMLEQIKLEQELFNMQYSCTPLEPIEKIIDEPIESRFEILDL